MDDDIQAIMPTVKAWEIIEQALIELGVGSRAEAGAKAIVARLAAHEPPILLCFPDQIKESSDEPGAATSDALGDPVEEPNGPERAVERFHNDIS